MLGDPFHVGLGERVGTHRRRQGDGETDLDLEDKRSLDRLEIDPVHEFPEDALVERQLDEFAGIEDGIDAPGLAEAVPHGLLDLGPPSGEGRPRRHGLLDLGQRPLRHGPAHQVLHVGLQKGLRGIELARRKPTPGECEFRLARQHVDDGGPGVDRKQEQEHHAQAGDGRRGAGNYRDQQAPIVAQQLEIVFDYHVMLSEIA